MTYYFAWVDKSETVFNPATHAREDEHIFGLRIEHAEGNFPSMEIDLRNPRVGLLASTRKQWCWAAYRDPDGDVTPLFFGRLVGVPQSMQAEIIRLTFVARPTDYEDQREALADTLRVRPYYDPVWFSEEDRADPDTVLEARPALWHIDRVTHAVTISDIIQGEDGTIVPDAEEVLDGSLDVSYSQSPARRVDVEASVQWAQYAKGSLNLKPNILAAFKEVTPATLPTPSGKGVSNAGVIAVVGGEEMIAAWPKKGTAIGGGWTVGASSLTVVGDTPLPPLAVGGEDAWEAIQNWPNAKQGSAMIRRMFERAGGFVVDFVNHTGDLQSLFTGPLSGEIEVLWVPVWRLSPSFNVDYEVSRDRTEVVRFSLSADVQPLLTDPGEEEVVRLTIGPADVDNVITNRRLPRYFNTNRGARSFEYLLSAARTILLSRARAVDVAFAVPFHIGAGLSCRMNMAVSDPRLPGGTAAGKVKQYVLVVENGESYASVVIGCTVGRDGDVTPVAGTPSYVDEGYVDLGYQDYDGAVIVPTAGDVGYSGLAGYAYDDDGVNLTGLGVGTAVEELTVTGGVTQQKAAAQAGTADSATAALDRINGYKTKVHLEMLNLKGGPFLTNIAPTVTELKVPRTIDLEDV